MGVFIYLHWFELISIQCILVLIKNYLNCFEIWIHMDRVNKDNRGFIWLFAYFGHFITIKNHIDQKVLLKHSLPTLLRKSVSLQSVFILFQIVSAIDRRRMPCPRPPGQIVFIVLAISVVFICYLEMYLSYLFYRFTRLEQR